jgi:hypothetical protein
VVRIHADRTIAAGLSPPLLVLLNSALKVEEHPFPPEGLTED